MVSKSTFYITILIAVFCALVLFFAGYYRGQTIGYWRGHNESDTEWQIKYQQDLPREYQRGYQKSNDEWNKKYLADQKIWFDRGAEIGKTEGESIGYNRGYAQGKQEWYQKGVDDGLQKYLEENYSQFNWARCYNCWWMWYSGNKKPDWPAPPGCDLHYPSRYSSCGCR